MSIWKGSREGQHMGIIASRLCQKATMMGARPAQAFSATESLIVVHRVVFLTAPIDPAMAAARVCRTNVLRPNFLMIERKSLPF